MTTADLAHALLTRWQHQHEARSLRMVIESRPGLTLVILTEDENGILKEIELPLIALSLGDRLSIDDVATVLTEGVRALQEGASDDR